MTNDIIARTYQHREGVTAGFTKRYGIKRLVYFEEHAIPGEAIVREKTLKRWPRAWKIALIERSNPNWTTSMTPSHGGRSHHRPCGG